VTVAAAAAIASMVAWMPDTAVWSSACPLPPMVAIHTLGCVKVQETLPSSLSRSADSCWLAIASQLALQLASGSIDRMTTTPCSYHGQTIRVATHLPGRRFRESWYG
jgi:hypothetical protein